jgi:hypothetical protein
VQTDRRSETRSIAVFKAAYIEHQGRLSFVTLRDISPSGVCFSGMDRVSVGDSIHYCIDGSRLKSGTVTWVGDGKFGVRVDEGAAHEMSWMMNARPRSIRLPVSGEVNLYVGTQRFQTTLHNLSLRGTCVENDGGVLKPGQLISMELAGQCFELATVKWVRQGRAGVCLAQPLGGEALNALLQRLQAGVSQDDEPIAPRLQLKS